MTAKGTFGPKLTPIALEDKSAPPNLGRMSIAKQFHGDLEATSVGEMLSARSAAFPNSAGYVAIEQVTGTLENKTGTFVLQHSATMNRGTPELSVIVVPDSGTGGLAGLSGNMKIIIEDRKHFYEFEYQLN